MVDATHATHQLPRLVTFGEAMIRYAPVDSKEEWHGKPSAASHVLRSVGGDELNVAVCLARLGWPAPIWVSSLPDGPLGDMVRESAADAGVSLEHCAVDKGGDIGTYTVLPELKTVHFQRRNSAFAHQRTSVDWHGVLKAAGPAWVHLTGITPMISAPSCREWQAGLTAAAETRCPVSFDFNHRPQLGTLDELWALVSPFLKSIHLLILSVASLRGLAALLGVDETDGAAKSHAVKRSRLDRGGNGEQAAKGLSEGHEVECLPLLRALHAKLLGPALACCFKERDEAGVQTRSSAIVDASGSYSTEETPTRHCPQDECGGGSAWAAGVIDRLARDLPATGVERNQHGLVRLGGSSSEATRRADLLAALCQEVPGDHSTVTRAQLEDHEVRFKGRPAEVGMTTGPLLSLNAYDAAARVEVALERLGGARVIAIIRAKNEALAVERAAELASLGFKAIEVTMDSAGCAEGTLLPKVVAAVGSRAVVGVGTVTSLAHIDTAFKGGASFALSPVRPVAGWGELGFVGECHRRGILAMPSAFTPQEIYECVEVHGAKCVKIFPAQLWSPSALSDLRRIGDFGKYRLSPSGGIDAANAGAWLAAGAFAVGMGSCLCGKDVAVAPGDIGASEAAMDDWRRRGRGVAEGIAKKLLN